MQISIAVLPWTLLTWRTTDTTDTTDTSDTSDTSETSDIVPLPRHAVDSFHVFKITVKDQNWFLSANASIGALLNKGGEMVLKHYQKTCL